MNQSKIIYLCGVFIFIFGISTMSYSQAANESPCNSILTRNSPKPKAYFLPSLFSEFTVEWYAEHLSAMKEPSMLSLKDCSVESYRFLWLRSFHAPIAVRLWHFNGQRFLVAKKLSGKGGYEPGKIVISRIKSLSEEEWSSFKNFLNESSFWEIPTEEPTVENPDGSITVGLDGAQWIMEGVSKNRYHIVDRWSAKAKYREACLYLLKLAGLKVKKADIY